MVYRAHTYANVNGFQGGTRTVNAYSRVARLGSVAMLGETWHYRRELAQALPGHWRIVQKPGESPAVVYNSLVWQCHGHGFFHVHRAIPGVSDSRTAAYALLQDRASGHLILFVSVHLTPSAWSNRYGRKKRRQIRRVWKAGVKRCLRQVRALQDQHGVPAVIGSDTNHRGRTWSRRLGGRRIKYVTAGNRIDKLAYIGWGRHVWQIRAETKHETRLGTGDGHKALTIRARIR